VAVWLHCLYLVVRHHEVEGSIYRAHQYDMPPLSVEMTGYIMRASLAVEYHDDDQMEFIVPASDLLDDHNQVRPRPC